LGNFPFADGMPNIDEHGVFICQIKLLGWYGKSLRFPNLDFIFYEFESLHIGNQAWHLKCPHMTAGL
jgi:hypothetical protein